MSCCNPKISFLGVLFPLWTIRTVKDVDKEILGSISPLQITDTVRTCRNSCNINWWFKNDLTPPWNFAENLIIGKGKANIGLLKQSVRSVACFQTSLSVGWLVRRSASSMPTTTPCKWKVWGSLTFRAAPLKKLQGLFGHCPNSDRTLPPPHSNGHSGALLRAS